MSHMRARGVRWGVIASVAAMTVHGGTLSAQRSVTVGRTESSDHRAVDELLARRTTVNANRVTRARAIDLISSAAKVPVQYRAAMLDAYPGLIDVHAADTPLGVLLEDVLNGTRLRVVAEDATHLMIVESDEASVTDSVPAVGTITGVVIDSGYGTPVSGATVSLQGSKRTTTTTQDGSFILRDVPVGDQILVAKLFGFRPARRTVTVREANTPALRIVLAPVASLLSGVVTTATGLQRKLSVGNDIVTLDVDSIMQVAPVHSVTDLLEGRVPGMTVQRTSGSPGDPARIRIRGSGSILQNNDPILVVDGVRMYNEQSDKRNTNIRRGTDTSTYAMPSPLDQIDPNMIATIEVLKGPSASALYGSDAANGVIVITTKRGGSRGVQWSVASDQGISYMPGQWPVTLWPWGRTAISDAPTVCLPGNEDACTYVDSLVPFQALNSKRYTVAGRGHSAGNTLSLLGQRGDLQYAYTVSARNELGLLKLPVYENERFQDLTGTSAPEWMRKPEQLTSWSANATHRMQLTNAASVSVTSTLNNSTQRRTGLSESFNSAVAQLSQMWIDTTQRSNNFLTGKPYEQATTDQTDITLSAQAQWQPVRWLPLTGVTGINIADRTSTVLLRAQLDPYFLFSGQQPSGYQQTVDGRSLVRTVTLNTTVPLWSKLSLAAGVNYQDQAITDALGYFAGLDKNVDNPSSGLLPDATQYSKSTAGRKTFGWFLEPQLAFQSRFFVMPGIRLDNNGLSGKNAGLNSLPKMNFSWIASEERFFPFRNVIDLFRVRGAVGVASVQPNPQDRFRLLQEIAVTNTPNDTAYYGDMLKLTGLGNTRLRPERSGEWESGFDAELFRGRLTTNVTVYRKVRHDAIVGLPLASSIGGGEVMVNLGVVQNAGHEVSLDAQLLESRQLAWNVGVSLSGNSNKVTRLNGTDQLLRILPGGGLSALTQIYRVGYPLNGAWTTPILSYHDLNHDGLLSPSEVLVGDSVVFMGSKEPTRLAAMRSDLAAFGGAVSLHVAFDYTGGLTQTDGIAAACGFGYLNSCVTALAMARFNPKASLNDQAAAVALASHRSAFGFMHQVSTWRFQTVSLNVNMGSSVAHFVRARTMSIALQGANLGLWTNYRGKDPDVNGYPWGDNTADYGQLPLPRMWSLRVSLGN